MSNRAQDKIAVTGIGMINSLGTCTAQCWEQMVQGRSGIGPIRSFDASSCVTRIGGELPEAYAEMEKSAVPRRMYKQTIPVTRLGLLSAREAISDSGFDIEKADPYRCAVISGSGQTSYQEGDGDPAKAMADYLIVRQMVNAIPAWISIKHGFKGPSYNVASACASGASAIAACARYIMTGECDAGLAVGVDIMLNRESILGFNELLALSERNDAPQAASRPFDKNRDGFVLANGGCALMLETVESARQRGASIYAVISGLGEISESHNIVAPEPTGDGMAQSMSLALKHGGVSLEKVGYISAHGTSTPHNDACETNAIKKVFGDRAYQIPVSSQKSMVGHTIGGAGAIECGVTALSLHHGVLTPTLNYTDPDPNCDLDYVPNEAREVQGLEAALSNSFGFGGHDCTIVLEKSP